MSKRTGSGESLARLGLLNREAPDLGGLICDAKRVYKAYCTSYQCCHTVEEKNGRRIKRDSTSLKLKNIKDRATTLCPDCGCALFWKTTYVST